MIDNTELHTFYNDLVDFKHLETESTSFIKLFHVNIRSINKNHESLKSLLSSLAISFDIIVLSELWTYKLECYDHLFQGYRFHYITNSTNHSSGVGIYIKDHLTYFTMVNIPIDGCEYLKVNIKSQVHKQKDLVIHCIYRHPGVLQGNFLLNLESVLLENNKYSQVIIGDLNINLLDESSHSTCKYQDLLSHFSFLPLILSPTRITQQSSTLIDHIMYNGCIGNKTYSGNIYADISDHLPNYAFIPFFQLHSKIKERPLIYLNSKQNLTDFVSLINNTQWQIHESSDNAASVFKNFYEHIQRCFEQSIPLVRMSHKLSKNKPWISISLQKLIKKKNLLYKRWIVMKNSDSWLDYMYHKKLCASLVNKAKKVHYQHSFSMYKQNIKKIWQKINTLIGNGKNQHEIHKVIDCQGQVITNPNEMAESFNNYFTNVASDLCNKMPIVPPTNLPYYNTDSIFLQPVMSKEIEFLIKKLKNAKGTGGLDLFTSLHFKLVAHIISDPLAKVFNKCICEGHFPNELKIAKVIPIHKSGPPECLNNYRPISLLSLVSKVFEKVLKSRLQSFIDKHNLLTSSQYGFRTNSSTTLAVTDFISTIELARNVGKHTIALFLDLRKAFDTVNHKILLMKLESLGIRGLPLQLLASYLTDRFQYTVLNNVSSSHHRMLHGVPQGSVLGPLLFLLYINDFQNCTEDASFRLFADDTVVIISHSDLNQLTQIANNVIVKITEWLHSNKLSLNVEKTSFMFFHVNKRSTNQEIPLLMHNNIMMSHSTSTKYLGFILDNQLSLSSHIQYLATKLRKWIGVFYKIACFLNSESKYLIYYSLCQSSLLYGIELYGHAASKHLKLLSTLQNRSLKALFQLDRLYPSKELYLKLGVFNLEYLIKVKTCDMLWSIIQPSCRLHVHTLINSFATFSDTHHYSTRSKCNFILNFNKSSFTSSISFKLLMLWNELPSNIKNTNTYSDFKATFSKFMTQNHKY